MRSPLTVFTHLLAAPERSSGQDGRRHPWQVWRRPRTLAVAAVGASLLGWGSASALSGPDPVPDSYGGRFVLTYGGQNTEVFNVSGCDMAGPAGADAVVKPCEFEVPANAAPALKKKIVSVIGASPTSPGDDYILTHYTISGTGQTTADYAAKGRFRITQVTLPVLDRLDTASAEYLGVELTPVSTDAPVVARANPNPVPALPAPLPFEVGLRVPGCQIPVNPPAVQIAGFTTTTPRSLSVSIDASGFPAVKLGSVRIPADDSTAVGTARDWVATANTRKLTVNMASWSCETGTRSNQFTLSLPVGATSMDPFPRTDGYFMLDLTSGLVGLNAPTVGWN